MSTNEYLATLNLSQLNYAINRAEQLIREKNEQPRVKIWRVTDSALVRGNFLEYKDAVDCFIIEAQKGINGDPEPTLEIVQELIIESELGDYI